MRQKHGLLLFIASCIPGCGQMHQGYMKRGASLLTAFCGVFALAVFLEVGALAVLMIPLWLYAFFDSYNLRSQIAEETAEPDAYLFGLSDLDSQRLAALCQQRHSVIGWGLVLLGFYMLWQWAGSLLSDLFIYFFGDDLGFYYTFRYGVPRLVVTVLIIALGVWFIRGPKQAKGGDIPAFTPPAEEPQPAPAPPPEAAAPEAEAAPDGEMPEEEGPHGDI